MPEKESQTNQEKDKKKYLIPIMGGKVVWAILNERKQQIDVVKQRDTGDMSMRSIEARYPNPDGATDEDGRIIIESSMVADFHLTESGQEELRQRSELALEDTEIREEYHEK